MCKVLCKLCSLPLNLWLVVYTLLFYLGYLINVSYWCLPLCPLHSIFNVRPFIPFLLWLCYCLCLQVGVGTALSLYSASVTFMLRNIPTLKRQFNPLWYTYIASTGYNTYHLKCKNIQKYLFSYDGTLSLQHRTILEQPIEINASKSLSIIHPTFHEPF